MLSKAICDDMPEKRLCKGQAFEKLYMTAQNCFSVDLIGGSAPDLLYMVPLPC